MINHRFSQIAPEWHRLVSPEVWATEKFYVWPVYSPIKPQLPICAGCELLSPNGTSLIDELLVGNLASVRALLI